MFQLIYDEKDYWKILGILSGSSDLKGFFGGDVICYSCNERVIKF